MALIWKYLKSYRRLLIFALLLAVVNQGFSLLDPQIFRIIIDKYLAHFAEFDRMSFFRGVIILLLASVGVALISRIAKNFQDYFVNVISQRLGAKIYAKGVAHSFSLPYSVFEDQRSGEHLLKLQKARVDTQIFITNAVNILFFSLIGVIFVLVYAFIVHYWIGLAYFLVIPILGLLTYILSRRIKLAQSQIVKETASLAGSTTETLRNVELVKSLGLEDQEISRLNNVNEQILQLELKKIVIIRKFAFIQGTALNTLRSLLLLLMILLIYNQQLTLGEFLTLYFYSFFIFTPLAELGNFTTQYQETRASVEQLEQILAIKPVKKPENPQILAQLNEIVFNQVSFSYQASQEKVLTDIDLSVKAGETIAFVGPSGSGKSTIIKLISGLYQPSAGQILYNNHDFSKIDFDNLRRRIGLVSQDTQLFAGTIRENLLFVKPEASDQDCLTALKSAAAIGLVDRGDYGLDTRIGEGGLKISGGERQRLAIARALLRNPEIIIFDEATSSLDSITEKEITQTIQEIEKFKSNIISILVAHRLSTVLYADRIYVLEKGQIIEVGTHNELLKKQGLYSALWREQQAKHELVYDLTD